MEKFWVAALKVTGPVAVVGLILWTVVQQLFEKDMLSLFETEQRFTITIIVLSGLMIGLVAAIILRGGNAKEKNPVSNEEKRSVKLKKSTIRGDFVMGDKIDKRGDE